MNHKAFIPSGSPKNESDKINNLESKTAFKVVYYSDPARIKNQGNSIIWLLLLYQFLLTPERQFQAIAAPRALQASTAASSGASFAVTLSQAKTAPAALQSSSQLRIHSQSPHP